MKNKEYKEYKEYKKHKRSLSGLSYKGYPIDRVIGSYLASYIWISRLQTIYILLFAVLKNRLNLKSQNTIITYSVDRVDYLKLLEGYFPNIEKQFIATKGGTLVERIYSFIDSVYYIAKASKFLFKENKNRKMYISNLLFVGFSMRVIDEIERQDINCDSYYSFNSSFMLESFFSFYFRKRNIRTYSLQHGMYFRYNGYVPSDIINYENCCAETLLCWGQYTIDEIKGMVPSDVTLNLKGNPIIENVASNRTTRRNTIYVMLPREIYLANSIRLLNILESIPDYDYVIRPHPSVKDAIIDYIDSKKRFELDLFPKPNEQLRSVSFNCVISFNSTSVFDIVTYEQNLLYYKENSEITTDMFRCFSNKEELLMLINNEEQNQNQRYFAKYFYFDENEK